MVRVGKAYVTMSTRALRKSSRCFFVSTILRCAASRTFASGLRTGPPNRLRFGSPTQQQQQTSVAFLSRSSPSNKRSALVTIETYVQPVLEEIVHYH